MSDLSEHVPEDVVEIPPEAIGFFCTDCVRVVEFSDWPADAINLPTPPRGWPGEIVRVVNTSHAPSCPAFGTFVAETGAITRYTICDEQGCREPLVLRGHLHLGLSWSPVDQLVIATLTINEIPGRGRAQADQPPLYPGGERQPVESRRCREGLPGRGRHTRYRRPGWVAS